MYMFTFAQDKQGLGPANFLPWTAWACVWAGLMLLMLAVCNACDYITRFTRFTGELFGGLIAILFLQQFVEGLCDEFRLQYIAGYPMCATSLPITCCCSAQSADAQSCCSSAEATTHPWLLINGFWGLFLAFGLLYTAWQLHWARTWVLGPAWLRNFMADYGVVSMVSGGVLALQLQCCCTPASQPASVQVGVWTGISYALRGHPPEVPRRLALPNTWSHYGFWSTSAVSAWVYRWHIKQL